MFHMLPDSSSTSASRWHASIGSSSPPELEGELIPPPPHALSSHDDFSQWATGHAAYESAAAVLVQTLQMAWLTDLRELKPLPVLTEGSSTLLGTPELRVLARAFPAEHRLRWRLLFSGSRDGMCAYCGWCSAKASQGEKKAQFLGGGARRSDGD